MSPAESSPLASSAKPPPSRPVSRAVSATVFAAVSANSATQFAIQAWMSYGFAREVWRIPLPLCVAVIVALDLFVTLFMILTYLLRSARLRTKTFVWSVLVGGIGSQLFAAEQFAAHEGWPGAVELFAALPALFLAASLHGLIIWRSHVSMPTAAAETEDGGGRMSPEPIMLAPGARLADAADMYPYGTYPTASRGDRGVRQLPQRESGPYETLTHPLKKGGRARRPTQSDGGTLAELARKRVGAGESCADVAESLGRSKRWVEMQTQDVRVQRSVSTDGPVQGTDGPVQHADSATRAGQGALPKGNPVLQDRVHQDLAPETGTE